MSSLEEPLEVQSDDVSEEFSAQYDYVAVFPWHPEDEKWKSKEEFHILRMVRWIAESGLDIYPYLSVQNDELIVLIKAPPGLLEKYADEIDFKLPLEPAVLQRICEAGDPANKIAPFSINGGEEFCSFKPYENIFGRFENNMPPELYCKNDGERVFSRPIRLKLVYYYLQAPRSSGGAGIKISKFLKTKRILAFYPLHNRERLDYLSEAWVKGSYPWNQPLEDVRKYFGEKIALYFAFMGHYTKCLSVPALLGLIVQLVVFGTGDFSSPLLPFFSVFICIWTIYMLEMWKREEKMIALRWGTIDFEEDEPERLEFKGEEIPSYINGKPMKHFPVQTKTRLVGESTALITLVIMLVIGCVASIYVLRMYLYEKIGADASTIASIANAVQITILNFIYGELATALTHRENHRTDTEYEDSLIAKIFVFQFVNSYTSFYYLAFIAPYLPRASALADDGEEGDYVGDCGFDDCMIPLAINVAIIFGTALTVNNIVEIVVPLVQNRLKQRAESKGVTTELTPPEKEYILLPYDVMSSSMKDYAEVAIQFGFMTIFIVALPMACLVALFNNIVEVKVDGWKLINIHQRPVPKTAEDIGNWQTVFSAVAVIAVVTNAGLICFTMSLLDDYVISTRMWIFFGFQAALILIQQFIDFLIPDEPLDVTIQRRRNEFIVSKVIDKVPDEEEDESDANPLTAAGSPKAKQFELVLKTYPGRERKSASTNVMHDKEN